MHKGLRETPSNTTGEEEMAKIGEMVGIALVLASGTAAVTGLSGAPMGADPNKSAVLINGLYCAAAGGLLGYMWIWYCWGGFGAERGSSAWRTATALIAGIGVSALAWG